MLNTCKTHGHDHGLMIINHKTRAHCSLQICKFVVSSLCTDTDACAVAYLCGEVERSSRAQLSSGLVVVLFVTFVRGGAENSVFFGSLLFCFSTLVELA